MKSKEFISYKELADIVGCSAQTIRKVHARRIIQLFDIDTKRLPKKGLLPLDCCEKYFDVKQKIEKKASH